MTHRLDPSLLLALSLAAAACVSDPLDDPPVGPTGPTLVPPATSGPAVGRGAGAAPPSPNGTPEPTADSTDPPERLIARHATTAGGGNQLGIWLWHIAETGYASHAVLAGDLAALGVKRVYVKVADGTDAWSTLDAAVPKAFSDRGIAPWAWAYHRPGDEGAQADVLVRAARAGYEGFVADVEDEYEGRSDDLERLFAALASARAGAVSDGAAAAGFELRATTFGNPADHSIAVAVIDRHVDAHMPQTYLEAWGPSFPPSAAGWIEVGNAEYGSLGVTKPLHHIVDAVHGIATPAELNEAVRAAGPETSIWRVPWKSGTAIWETLRGVDWHARFGEEVSGSVTVACPDLVTAGEAVAVSGTASGAVVRVRLDVDGVNVSELEADARGNWSAEVVFAGPAGSRELVVTGLAADRAELARLSQRVQVEASAPATMRLDGPDDAKVGTPVSFSGRVTGGIRTVTVSVDGWQVAMVPARDEAFGFTHTFPSAGRARVVVVRGHDAGGRLLAQAQLSIDVTEPVVSSLTLSLPEDIRVGVEVHFSGTASDDVRRVRVEVDGWEIGVAAVAAGRFAFDYTFSGVGPARRLLAQGFDERGAVLVEVSDRIDVAAAEPASAGPGQPADPTPEPEPQPEPEPEQEPQPQPPAAGGDVVEGVPYFYQYANGIRPGASCQNTSMAMVLAYFGAAGETPDQISSWYGTRRAQTVAGFQEVFNSEAAHFGLAVRDRGTTAGTVGELRALLAAGVPTVVHGYFTASGHVIVLLGYDGESYWAHDPAGRWNEAYQGGGYGGWAPAAGRRVRYGRAAMEQAIAPDGMVWMHEIYTP